VSKVTLGCLAALICGLAGCEPVSTQTPNKEQDKYRIVWYPPHGIPTIWTTPHAPVADTYGFIFILADGRRVQVSGNVVIEEKYR
jgi:hypothetical protein